MITHKGHICNFNQLYRSFLECLLFRWFYKLLGQQVVLRVKRQLCFWICEIQILLKILIFQWFYQYFCKWNRVVAYVTLCFIFLFFFSKLLIFQEFLQCSQVSGSTWLHLGFRVSEDCVEVRRLRCSEQLRRDAPVCRPFCVYLSQHVAHHSRGESRRPLTIDAP